MLMLTDAERDLVEAKRVAALARRLLVRDPDTEDELKIQRFLEPTRCLVQRTNLCDLLLVRLDDTIREYEPLKGHEHIIDVYLKVVGLRHYTTKVGSGAGVLLVAEPNNPFDSNAFAVHAMGDYADDTQIGHVCAAHAAVLAGLVDLPFESREKFFDVTGAVVEPGGDDHETLIRVKVKSSPNVHVATALQHYFLAARLRVTPCYLERRVEDAQKRLECDTETVAQKRRRSH